MKSPYPRRQCAICERMFQPASPNQKTCRRCRPKRRRFYDRNYQRRERRRMRRSMAALDDADEG